MALPNVKVNVGEETLVTANTVIPFVPAILLKTKSGPIGTIETVTSEAQFISKFGQSDESTPSAYAVQTYLRSYAYVLVTRISDDSKATVGTGKVSFTKDDTQVELFKATTDYKTDLYNLKDIKLVYDSSSNKIWLDVSSIVGKTTISIKEDIMIDTIKAAEYDTAHNLIGGLEYKLNKLVASINAMHLGITLENLFVNKTAEDKVPEVADYTEGFTVTISGGNSGNDDTISNEKIKGYIDLYNSQDNNLDAMIIPEYTSYEIVNYAAALADKNNFELLVAPGGESVSEVQQKIVNYTAGNKGSIGIYFPNVYYSGFNAEIPASIAVLHCYAKSDISAKWSAPAGIQRGTLNLVSKLSVNLTTSDMETLYDSAKPINCINDISGKGFVVWGNKSLSSETSFFDRLNVARLVKYVTKKVYAISYDYLFEPITSTTFTSWVLKVENVLDTIKSGSGIDSYEVIMDSSINTEESIARNELNGIVKIKPLEVAEFITIDFTVTDTIASNIE